MDSGAIPLPRKDGPIDPYFLVSERLGFRRWCAGDEALAEGLWGDPEVTTFSGGPFDPGQVRQRLDREMSNLDRYGVQYWPIFRRDTNAHVGCCGLQPRDMDARIFELGFHLRRDAWGCRYAFEAAQAVIGWAATQDVTALFAGHHPDNLASGRTLRRLGFVYTHDEYYPPTRQEEPCYLLSLSASAPRGVAS